MNIIKANVGKIVTGMIGAGLGTWAIVAECRRHKAAKELMDAESKLIRAGYECRQKDAKIMELNQDTMGF